jgi:hypothetical protein
VAATEYRRRKGDEHKPWHFCANCKSWPIDHFDLTSQLPRRVCSECETLQRRQMCTREEAFV